MLKISKRIIFVDNSTRCFCLFRLSIAKALKDRGYEIFVLSPPPYEEYLYQLDQFEIKHIPYKISNKFSPLEGIRLFLLFKSIYQSIKPEFIFHYTIKPNIYGSLAAKFSGFKSVAIVPGTGSIFQEKNWIRNIVIILYRIAFRYPQKIWVLNIDDKQKFEELRIVRNIKLEVLPGEGVDTKFYSPTKTYSRGTPFIFLYIGRILKEKGLEYLVEASEMLKRKGISNFEVRLAGLIDGLSKEVITHDTILSWEQKGLIKYLGSISDIRDTIEEADCIVLPTFYGEGIPRSLMEACAMERMIIATDNVGCREILDDKVNGLMCLPKNATDLSEKMELALTLTEEEIRAMGKNGRIKILREFDDSIIIKKYLIELGFVFK